MQKEKEKKKKAEPHCCLKARLLIQRHDNSLWIRPPCTKPHTQTALNPATRNVAVADDIRAFMFCLTLIDTQQNRILAHRGCKQ